MLELYHFLGISFFMFLCGAFGVMFRRNLIFILMSVELMLNAVNLLFITASRFHQNYDGQIMVFFIITVAACEAGVGLAMVIALFRKYADVRTDFLRVLKG